MEAAKGGRCFETGCLQVEESYLSAEEFCRMIGQESSVVLQNELAVLQGVGFDLVVYNPYHPLDGFLQACISELLLLHQSSCWIALVGLLLSS